MSTAQTPARCQGKVFLVGAGPGDPELLTLKAARLLAQADVVLVDDLVSDAIIALKGTHTRVIYVGKRGGCRSTPQAFIEKLMIHEAQQGHQVVRLKGGDPFIFGRGGEECASLRDAGVACEVVNGITAGLAAPSSLGVPLTHRDYCHGAIFVTAHAGEDSDSEPNWPALVATGMPLVVYMGVSRVVMLVSSLLAAGMRADMPAAAIQNATRADAKSVVTTVSNLAQRIAETNISSPAILVIGETVALAESVTDLIPRENEHLASA